jgi:hypothetical protein
VASDRYTIRVAGCVVVQNALYALLLKNLVRFTVEAAVAHSADESSWDQDQLRRRGLDALEVARDGKALWSDGVSFNAELAQARQRREATEFTARNELDPEFCARLDGDLRRLLRQAGYDVPSLMHTMKPFFAEIDTDLRASASGARKAFIEEIVNAMR